MFSDVLLTVDFDRTLTAPDSTIPQRNLEAIRYFIAHGGSFTLNTGRSVNTMGALLHTLPVNAPFLLYNGSADYENGQLSNCARIPLDLWQTLAQVHAHCPELNLELQGTQIHYLYNPKDSFKAFYDTLGWKWAEAVPGTDVGPFIKFAIFGEIHHNAVSDMFSGSAEELARFDAIENWIKQTYGDRVCVFRAAPRIIDVHAAGVSKAVAARRLQKKLGKKHLVCVGDAENDLTMLNDADFAFVPADAILADQFPNVCCCAEGAVADVIYKKIPQIIK